MKKLVLLDITGQTVQNLNFSHVVEATFINTDYHMSATLIDITSHKTQLMTFQGAQVQYEL